MWAWIFLLLLLIFFSVRGGDAFLSVSTAMNIMTYWAPILLLGIGHTFVIISGGIDLSIGWTMGLASVVSALVMRGLYNGGMPEWAAIALGAAAGIFVTLIPGMINGLLIARVNVPP